MTSDEPKITINGKPLFEGQALAVRVAISRFYTELLDPDEIEVLGEIGGLYRQRLEEVLRIIMNK